MTSANVIILEKHEKFQLVRSAIIFDSSKPLPSLLPPTHPPLRLRLRAREALISEFPGVTLNFSTNQPELNVPTAKVLDKSNPPPPFFLFFFLVSIQYEGNGPLDPGQGSGREEGGAEGGGEEGEEAVSHVTRGC